MKQSQFEKYNILSNNRSNIIASLKDSSDIYLIWEHVSRIEFNELRNGEIEEGIIRIFSITGEGCKIQFRNTQPLPHRSVNKPKNLIATAFFSKQDLEYILERINN